MKRCSYCKKDTIRDLTSGEKINQGAQVLGKLGLGLVSPINLFKNTFYTAPKSLIHMVKYKSAKKLYKCDNCKNYVLICPHCGKAYTVGSKPPLFCGDDIFVCANCYEEFIFDS